MNDLLCLLRVQVKAYLCLTRKREAQYNHKAFFLFMSCKLIRVQVINQVILVIVHRCTSLTQLKSEFLIYTCWDQFCVILRFPWEILNFMYMTGRPEIYKLGQYRPNSQIKNIVQETNFSNFSLKDVRTVSFLSLSNCTPQQFSVFYCLSKLQKIYYYFN